MNPVSASVYPTGTTAPTYLAQPGPALPVRTGVTTLRLGEGGGTPLGCTPCAAGAAGPAPPCVTPVITPGTAATTAEGVQVTTSSGARVYRPVVDGLIAHPPGATHAISTLPPTCDEDAILCNLLKGQHHYLNWHAGNPVYNVPSRALLPTGWENALNGFLPCTFDEHQYDDICSGCKKGGSCTSDKCKYKPGHFLITIEPSRTEEEKAYGPFVLAANGIRGRNIWLTRGKRYYFTFKACQLSVDPRLTIDGEPNPNAGLPLPPSSGGVKVTDEDIPLTFQNVSIIFSATPDGNYLYLNNKLYDRELRVVTEFPAYAPRVFLNPTTHISLGKNPILMQQNQPIPAELPPRLVDAAFNNRGELFLLEAKEERFRKIVVVGGEPFLLTRRYCQKT